MKPPFTISEFLDVFAKYNQAVWPAQIIAYILAIMVIAIAARNIRHSGKIIACTLALFWMITGIIYHIIFFAAINKAAYLFGLFFVVQGLLIVFAGLYRQKLAFKFTPSLYSILGTVLIIYATLVYPMLGYFLGHRYPSVPSFGIAPCPTTIFTFGMFLWTTRPLPKYLLLIPLIWSVIGFNAALYLRIYEDIGLLIAGVIATILIVVRDTKLSASA